MAVRAQVALPAIVTFVFGAACGLVVGWLAGTGGQTRVEGEAPRRAGAPAASPRADSAAQEVQLREALALHEELLESDPENPRLLRTLGDYHLELQQPERALDHYRRAEQAARAAGETTEASRALMGQAIARAEGGDVTTALEHLREATRLEPADTTARLLEAYLLLTRVMPEPPPGFDRREALRRTEALLAEVLEVEPTNERALELQGWIDGVRRGRDGAGAATAEGERRDAMP